jgi:hypothetical protein
MFFTLIALGAAGLGCECEKKKAPEHPHAAAMLQSTHCEVGYFDPGDHRMPHELEQFPSRCLDDLAQSVRKNNPALLLIIGRCDYRELRPEIRRVYATNLSLAYQRALSVKELLCGLGRVKPTAVLLSAGASNVGNR